MNCRILPVSSAKVQILTRQRPRELAYLLPANAGYYLSILSQLLRERGLLLSLLLAYLLPANAGYYLSILSQQLRERGACALAAVMPADVPHLQVVKLVVNIVVSGAGALWLQSCLLTCRIFVPLAGARKASHLCWRMHYLPDR